MTITHQQVNRIVRVLLVLTVVVAFGFTILAARPPARYFGFYPAIAGTPAAINADGGVPAAFVTLNDPAVISFPAEWELPEQLCMVLRLDRGNANTAVEFNDFPPQIDWDVRADETLLINDRLIEGHASDNAVMVLGNDLIKTKIQARLPYLINWIGQATIPLYKNKPLSGLACVKFTLEDKDRISSFLFITFNMRNIHVERQPAYYFRYNDPTPPNTQPPQTFTLQRRSIDDYLHDLVVSQPSVVRLAPR